MRINQFDLNLFVVFEAIYSQGNLTRAGEVLNLAQPTVSNALTRIRAVYNDPLFVRAGRGVTPTPLANRLIVPVRQSLKQMQASLDDNLPFVPEHTERSFRLSVSELASSKLIPGLIKDVCEVAPKANLHILQMPRDAIAGALANGDLDLALDIPQLPSRALRRQRIGQGEHVCVFRKGHAITRKALKLDNFLQMSHIVVSSRMHGSSFAEIQLNRMGIRIKPRLRMQHYLPALKALESCDYALVVPRSVAEQFDLVVKELPFDQEALESWLYWHRNADQDPANIWFREILLTHCG